jgi:tetratricopeptide (TPR) repeat protein
MKHWLGGLYLALALAACGESDLLTAARAACENADSEPEARINACTTLIETGDLDAASHAAALARRGSALQEGGDAQAAMADFNAALGLDGGNWPAVLGRAGVLIASGQLDAAEPLVRQLIEAGEHVGAAHQFDGDIALQRSDFTAAIAAYDRSLAADGRNGLAMSSRARAKQASGDRAGALVDYDAALALNPQLSPAYAGRCWIRALQQEGDLAAARSDAEDAARLDPRNTYGQLCRGLLQLRAGEWEGARLSYEAELEVESGNPQALFGRGIARRRAGDSAGREDMNLARDFDSHIGERFDEMGVRTY